MAAAGGAEPGADEVYAEQVAQAAQAVAAAVAANNAQQAAARQWLESHLPADAAAHAPGSHQGPNL